MFNSDEINTQISVVLKIFTKSVISLNYEWNLVFLH